MVISSILMEAMLHFVSKFQIKFQVFLKDSFSLSLKGVDLMQRRYIQIQNNNNNKQLFLYVFKQRGSEPGSKTCSWGYPTPRVPLLQPSLLSSHENPHCSCLRTQCRVRQITHTLAVAFPLCQGRCSVGLREPLLPTAHWKSPPTYWWAGKQPGFASSSAAHCSVSHSLVSVSKWLGWRWALLRHDVMKI